MKLFPYICECGFNTMDAQKAREHANTHLAEKMRETFMRGSNQDANGRMVFVCPDGYENGMSTVYNHHGEPFYITQAELDSADGWIACEYCETQCLRIDQQ